MKRHNLGTVIRFEFTRTVLKPKFWLIFPKTTSPMITAARPITMAPRPALTSAKP